MVLKSGGGMEELHRLSGKNSFSGQRNPEIVLASRGPAQVSVKTHSVMEMK